MSKELNIIQAMEMPVGTKFNFDTEAMFLINGAKFIEVLKGEDEVNILCWDGRRDSQVRVTSNTAEMKFIPIQKPVSFMEVVESTKVCMVKHKLLENKYVWFKYYHFFNVLMNELSKEFNSQDLKEIILNGEWYIEESEEN